MGGQIVFTPEFERIENVMLKLAQGHAAYEFSLIQRDKPNHFWYGLLSSLSEEENDLFNSVHFQQNVGEMGSRSLQRLLVVQLSMQHGQNTPIMILSKKVCKV